VKRTILWAVLCGALHAQQVQFSQLNRRVLEDRFARISGVNKERAAILQTLFAEAGCSGVQYEERRVRGSRFSNLVCTLKGSSDQTIFVTAHYDKVAFGEGAIDNWTGASLLPSLYESLSKTPRRLTFVFVATCDEEKGLVGSREFVAKLTREDRASAVANINIDSLGLTPTKIWVTRSDKTLVNLASAVAQGMKLPVSGMSVDKVGDSDSRPFFEKKIPVIDFHSLTSETFPILHTNMDSRIVMSWDDYYDSYRLISGFLAYLDGHPEAQPTHK
jgi:hypothetical protein